MTTPTLAGVTLPADTTRWTDEHTWTPVGQSQEIDVGGSLVVEYTSPAADGRPVTLALGWITKTTLDALKDLRDAAEQTIMALVLPDGREMDVLWRHEGRPPLEAAPIVDYTATTGTDYYDVVARLMEVTA